MYLKNKYKIKNNKNSYNKRITFGLKNTFEINIFRQFLIKMCIFNYIKFFNKYLILILLLVIKSTSKLTNIYN